jgi:hypothetical protein
MELNNLKLLSKNLQLNNKNKAFAKKKKKKKVWNSPLWQLNLNKICDTILQNLEHTK